MEYILTKNGIESAAKVSLKNCLTGEEGRKSTVFSGSYNEDGINFLFECEDEDIYADITEFNGELYNQDVVEVFISPDGNLAKYIELEVSPLENVLQLKIENFDFDGGINKTYIKEDLIKRKVTLTEKGWNCEFFVPYTILGSSDIERTWKFNAYRIDRNDKANGRDYYSFNPTYKAQFHRPQYFIDLTFEK